VKGGVRGSLGAINDGARRHDPQSFSGSSAVELTSPELKFNFCLNENKKIACCEWETERRKATKTSRTGRTK
jgi:hypothetical protein